ncbi:MAG: YidC/Oxa1 family insertase periplasmic-domain containing protein, partial [Planctomycetes bacterium]|nr:YidC/Oxa1 family insertase periplasmic-domain containing protein [Planctomycetota bacterium]
MEFDDQVQGQGGKRPSLLVPFAIAAIVWGLWYLFFAPPPAPAPAPPAGGKQEPAAARQPDGAGQPPVVVAGTLPAGATAEGQPSGAPTGQQGAGAGDGAEPRAATSAPEAQARLAAEAERQGPISLETRRYRVTFNPRGAVLSEIVLCDYFAHAGDTRRAAQADGFRNEEERRAAELVVVRHASVAREAAFSSTDPWRPDYFGSGVVHLAAVDTVGPDGPRREAQNASPLAETLWELVLHDGSPVRAGTRLVRWSADAAGAAGERSADTREVVFRYRWSETLEIRKTYVFVDDDSFTKAGPPADFHCWLRLEFVNTGPKFTGAWQVYGPAGLRDEPRDAARLRDPGRSPGATNPPTCLYQTPAGLEQVPFTTLESKFKDRDDLKAFRGQTQDANARWAAIFAPFFAATFTPEDETTKTQGVLLKPYRAPVSHVPGLTEELFAALGYEVEPTIDAGSLAAPATSRVEFRLFIGPKSREVVAAYGFEDKITYTLDSVTRPLAAFFGWFLDRFFAVFGNYGWAVVAMTVLVRVLLLPLSIYQQKSFLEHQQKMKVVQPRMEKIKEKYKNDKPRQQQEFMRLMREERVSLLPKGCWTILLQMPVFIGLFRLFNLSFDMRHAHFGLWITDLSATDAVYLVRGVSLPFLASPEGTYVNVLPLVYVALMLLQAKMQPKAPTPEMQQQQRMMGCMFVVFGFIFYSSPSGFMLYFITSMGWGFVEQLTVKRWVSAKYGDAGGRAAPAGKEGPAGALAGGTAAIAADERIRGLVAAGRRLLDGGDATQAREKVAGAVSALEAVEGKKAKAALRREVEALRAAAEAREKKERLDAEARAAFDATDWQTARKKYEESLRAERDEYVEARVERCRLELLLAEAAEREKAGDLSGAAERFRAAQALGSGDERPDAGLTRVAPRLLRTRFDEALGEARGHEVAGRWKKAEQEFNRAARLAAELAGKDPAVTPRAAELEQLAGDSRIHRLFDEALAADKERRADVALARFEEIARVPAHTAAVAELLAGLPQLIEA